MFCGYHFNRLYLLIKQMFDQYNIVYFEEKQVLFD